MAHDLRSTQYLPPWVGRGFYAFICHADQDKPRIKDLRLVPSVTKYGVRLVIDRDKPIIEVDNPNWVYTFRGGKKWRDEMESYVTRARCVLILWSENMEQRIREEPDGGCIAQEILTGLRNGTAFFCWLDTTPPSPKPICGALAAKVPGFKVEFQRTIESRHILPLVRRSLAEGPGLGQLEEDMTKLAIDLDDMITASPSTRYQLEEEDPRLNKLLNLINREQAVIRIVDKGVVHVISGREPACRVHDFIQRLKEIELPPKHRSRGTDWRAMFVRGDFDPDTPWVQRMFEWPAMMARSVEGEKFKIAVQSGRDRLYDNIAAMLDLRWEETQPESFPDALNAYLETSADAFLLTSDIRTASGTAECDVKLVEMLRTTVEGLSCRNKLRIVLTVLETEKKSRFALFQKKTPSHPLIGSSARLEDLQAADLSNWAVLTEAVVGRPFNRIMDSVNRIYRAQAQSALSMFQLRETLEQIVLNWLAEAPGRVSAWSQRRTGEERNDVQNLSA